MTLTDTGHVNEDFDRAFIDLICRGKAQQFLRDWDTDRLRAAGGNGAQELRNWLLIAGVVQDQPGRLLGYEPVYAEWRQKDWRGHEFVYLWADGIYLNVRADERRCLLVVIGCDVQGNKHFLAIEEGFRESAVASAPP